MIFCKLRSAWGTRFLIPMIVGFAPLATMLASWVPSGTLPGSSDVLIKAFAIPFLLAELSVVLIAAVHPNARRIEIDLPRYVLICLAALLILAFGTGILAATEPLMALTRTSTYLIHLLFGAAVFRLISSGTLTGQDLLQGLLSGFVATSLCLIYFIQGVVDVQAFNWTNYLPGYDNIRRLGYYSAPIVALCLGSAASCKQSLQRVFYFTIAALGLTLIFWSGTRGAIYALFATYLLLAVLAPDLRKVHNWGAVAAVALSGAFFARLLVAPGGSLGFDRLAQMENFSSGRVQLWQESLQLILKRPWMGYGEGQVGFLLPGEPTSIFHPHNLLLQSLLAWGIAGTVLLAVLAWTAIKKAVAVARAGAADTLPFVMGALSLLLYSAIDGTLFHVTSAGLFAACSAVILSRPSAQGSPLSQGCFRRSVAFPTTANLAHSAE